MSIVYISTTFSISFLFFLYTRITGKVCVPRVQAQRITAIVDSSRSLVTASSVNRRCVKSRRSVACLFRDSSRRVFRTRAVRETRVHRESLREHRLGDRRRRECESRGSRSSPRAQTPSAESTRIPSEERCSREQWRDRHAPRNRRRVHDVDDTSVPVPRGMVVFTSRVRTYLPQRRYDDGVTSSSTVKRGREPRREPP